MTSSPTKPGFSRGHRVSAPEFPRPSSRGGVRRPFRVHRRRWVQSHPRSSGWRIRSVRIDRGRAQEKWTWDRGTGRWRCRQPFREGSWCRFASTTNSAERSLKARVARLSAGRGSFLSGDGHVHWRSFACSFGSERSLFSSGEVRRSVER